MIFATARVQGRIWAGEGSGGFAAFKNLYKAEELPKLALDLGNWASATREGRLTGGRATADCAGALPFAAAAVGTEELALSPAELKKLSETAGIPLLASNLYLRTNKKPDFLKSWHLTEAGGRKIGVFAQLISDPTRPNRRKYFPKYKLEEEVYESERAISALKKAGAQLTVMMLGIDPGKTAGEDYFRGFISRLPRVDLVITDEPSVKKPFKVNKTWIVPAGRGLSEAARLLLTLDPSSGRLKGLKYMPVPVDAEKYGEDAGMLKVIGKHREATRVHYARKVGKLSAALPLKAGRETPAAAFAADCMKRWARTNAAVIGLDEVAAPLPGGPVTLGDLHSSFPRESSVVFVKIRGDDLESALTALYPSGITVSGLKLYLRDGAVERAEAEKGRLVPGRIYRLAVPDTLASGRDNPLLFRAMEFANSRRSLRSVMRWCFGLRSVHAVPEGGRTEDAAGEK